MASSASKVPLKCDICPKKPRFSDISHLLTHISSKTHLSNIFKARVRLDFDTESRRLVEDYDQWYAEWSIQDLLAERLSQKDNKMSKPRARATQTKGGGGRGRGVTSAHMTAVHPVVGYQTAARGRPPGVNPGSSLFNREGRGTGAFPDQMSSMVMGSLGATGISERINPYLPPIPAAYGSALPYVPYMSSLDNNANYSDFASDPNQVFLQGHWDRLPHVHPTISGQAVIDAQSENEKPQYEDSAQHQRRVQRAAALKAEEAWRQNRQLTGETDTTTQVSETPDGSSSQLTEDYILVSPPPPKPIDAYLLKPLYIPNLTLKGVVYPGMGLFDAATVDEKAKRNQKKSEATYKALEALSKDIADNHGWENVWQRDDKSDDMFCPFKARIITGYPAPSSIASLSRSPSPVRPTSRILHSRVGSGRCEPTDDNLEYALINNIAPRRRMHIPKREDHDPSHDNHDPFVERPWQSHPNRLAYHDTINPHQENKLAKSLNGSRNAKTEDDGTDSGVGQPVPTTELSQAFPPQGATFASYTGPMLPPTTPYHRTLPNPVFTPNPVHMSAYNTTPRYFQDGLSRYPVGYSNTCASPNRYHANTQLPNGFFNLSSPTHTMNTNHNSIYPQLSPSHHGHYAQRYTSTHNGMSTNLNMSIGFSPGVNGGGFGVGISNDSTLGINDGFNHGVNYGLGYASNPTDRLDDLAQVAARHPGSDFQGTDGGDDSADEDGTLTAVPSSALDDADAAAIASVAAAEAAAVMDKA